MTGKRLIIILFFLAALFFTGGPARAQTAQPPNGPIYVVQAGDTLWDIAVRFGVTLDALTGANGLTKDSPIGVGQQLVIPGLEGIQGVLVTEPVSFGESLRSLSRRYQVPERMLARLNHLISPESLYAGYNLVIPQAETASPSYDRASLTPGQSLLELAALKNTNPWSLVKANDLAGGWDALPGDVLLLPGGSEPGPGALPGAISKVEVDPFPLGQGRTTVIRLSAPQGATLSGSLMGHELHFFESQDGTYVALQGVGALADPGVYPLALKGTLPGGSDFAFSQMVAVKELNYPYDRPLTVDPSTIDPAVTKPEDAEWSALALPATLQKYWNGSFQMPSPLPKDYCLESGDCWTSRFGNRRSYNGSAYNLFHTGLDIAGGAGTEIFAPADGVVVFTGPLTVRGNATMIDHGWGVYTGYMHQSEIKVKVGDLVKAGQVIGLVGGTGRVEGPHLHWEVWAGGVQVDPLEWLEKEFP